MSGAKRMTQADVAEAIRLRDEEGLGPVAISKRLGFSRRSISRRLDPNGLEKSRAYQNKYKKRKRKTYARLKRASARRNRRKCGCGKLMGVGSTGEKCMQCLQEDRHFRNVEFAQRWREGASIEDLGKEFGLTKSSVYAHAKRLREYGYDLPKRAKGRPKLVPAE